MNPTDDQSNGRVGAPLSDHNRPIVLPTRDQASPQNTAAANVIRGQLDAIYSGKSGENTPHTTPVQRPVQQPSQQTLEKPRAQSAQTSSSRPNNNPQDSTHAMRTSPPNNQLAASQPNKDRPTARPIQQPIDPARTQITSDQWKQYHSAWQKYYQMYYERYYANHLTAKEQELSRLQKTPGQTSETDADNKPVDLQANAMKELRQQIQQKVRDSAKKVKKSRHFMPAMAGITVLLVFMFLQYNRIIFGAVAAYTTPGAIDPQNIIVDASTDVAVSPEPRMIIPKINIDAPVVYGAASDTQSQNAAMRNGIAHFSIPGANAVPGQVGNAVFAAHSSNDAFAAGDYKFIFAQNEKLVKGDIIYMNYQSKRYTYKVTSTEVVMPTEVSKVQLKTSKPMLTLISCVPLGTAEKRLLVFAEQISPDPNGAQLSDNASSGNSKGSASAAIPGKPSPTLLERLFGAS